MKSLGEIRKNIISFYKNIQTEITDFSIGSVISGIIYAFSAVLENNYREISAVQRQAYIATATGEYLDRLIEGTYGLARNPATRNFGYVVVYANSPLANPNAAKLVCANYNTETGELTRTGRSTKFVGYNNAGDEGIVYTLVAPRDANATKIDPSTGDVIINLDGKKVQYLVLPVVSTLTGTRTHIREGALNSFPSAPAGLAGVLNTYDPGTVFFSVDSDVVATPYYSRYTQITNYIEDEGTFEVLNAYNFSKPGTAEISRDIHGNRVRATYVHSGFDENNLPVDYEISDGIILRYIDSASNYISLITPILDGDIPTINSDGLVYTLDRIEFEGVTVSVNTVQDVQDFLFAPGGASAHAWEIRQRAESVSDELVFDPDDVIDADLKIPPASHVTGASDPDTDAQYRTKLRAYLAGLSRSTNSALVSGALQVPGITFARVLPPYSSPRGSTVLLASNSEGLLTGEKRREITELIKPDWKASGVNVIVRSPNLTRVNVTVTLVLEEGQSPEVIRQQINDTTSEFLRSKVPGESVKYTDLLERLASVGGVSNVFNLVLNKRLTDHAYHENTHKTAYDHSLLDVMFHLNGTHSVGLPIPEIPDYDPITYERPGDTVWNNLAQELLTCDTSEAFLAYVINRQSLFANTDNFMYHASYLLGEPLDASLEYPMVPDIISYSAVRDYTAEISEIFRLNTITLDLEIKPFIGIRVTTA